MTIAQAVPVISLWKELERVAPRGTATARTACPTHRRRTHRTAAATVVLFLERLRLGADTPAIARAEVLR